MLARSLAAMIPRVRSTSRTCSEMTSHSLKNASLRRAAAYPSFRARSLELRSTIPSLSFRRPRRMLRQRGRSGRSQKFPEFFRADCCRRRSAISLPSEPPSAAGFVASQRGPAPRQFGSCTALTEELQFFQAIDILDVVILDSYIVAVQLLETGEPAQRVVVIV